MDDGVDSTQGVPEGEVVAEVAQRDLDPDAVGAQAAGVTDQAADGDAGRKQGSEQGPSDGSGGAGEEQHRREATGARRVPRMRTPPRARRRLSELHPSRGIRQTWPT